MLKTIGCLLLLATPALADDEQDAKIAQLEAKVQQLEIRLQKIEERRHTQLGICSRAWADWCNAVSP